MNVNKVACPFWPYQFKAGTLPIFTADYYVMLGDSPEIVPASALPLNRPAYPLLFGILKEWPEPTLVSDALARVDIQFVENDTRYLTPPPMGALQPFQGKSIFPFTPDWSTEPKSGAAQVDFERQNIGQGRVTADAFYPQPSRRLVEQYFTLEENDWPRLLRFWLDNGGNVQSFYLPASLSEAQLTRDVAEADTVLVVDNPAAIGTNRYVMLADGEKSVPVIVADVIGNNWNLTRAVGSDFSASQTRAESLIFARFDTTEFRLDFESPGIATATLNFRELPLEDQNVNGERVGVTMGALPTYAYLYAFTANYPGNPTRFLFTGFERDLIYNGDTYKTAPFSHDDIQEAATMERQTVTVTSRLFDGNPLNMMVPFALEFPLLLDIIEVDVMGNNAGNPKTVFSGEIDTCDADGPFLSATAKSLSWIFDRQIPRRLIQTSCNWILFENFCGVIQANWQWTGTVVGFDTKTFALSLAKVASTNKATLTANFFACGFVSIGNGATAQVRMLTSSTALDANGNMTLTIATPFSKQPVAGDAVTFYPGCDGKRTTCASKFNNYVNFGGFPFTPVGNLSTMTSTANTGAGGGKK